MTDHTPEVEQQEAETTTPIECSPEELSTNFFWTFGKQEVFNLQTTIRGNPDAAEIIAHLDAVLVGNTQVIARGGHAKPIGRQDSGIITQPATPAAIAADLGQAAPPEPPAPTNGGMDAACALIEVGTSYQGGKTQLKFHCDGMEHPLTYTKAVGDMVRLLAPLGFTAAHIVVGKKYSVPCIVTYEKSEKYRNVVSVRKA
jgi:hypothetical protein